ncbi:hypothetical protein DHEL01_v207171 [Diaporthe helianthi]|uniref:Protein kinase domain-containing protein n=1 Tax=Diaporthe helianthi TaxID=158607 RepID=A0A2P5HW03_DIAHE|nr:hypothetical protein DHEL01_v207171 [Diaporthe helianthi]
MQFINYDVNSFSEQTEDPTISGRDIAEPAEVAQPDQDATQAKSASDGATAPSPKSGGDVGRGRKPGDEPPPAKKIKLTFKSKFNSGGVSSGKNPFKAPGASSAKNPFKAPAAGSGEKPLKAPGAGLGSNPFKPNLAAPLESGSLVWAPRTWRPDLKPMLRVAVKGANGRNQIKYLTWDQQKGERFKPERPPGDFFRTARYLVSEPLMLSGGGDWNHARISFFEIDIDKGEDTEVIFEIFQYERIQLQTMSKSAIWPEKPCVEWATLQFKTIYLRDTFGPGMHHHRGRLRVVTHEAFGNGEFEMVMKIWPTPNCSRIPLENEMMAYRACDGKGITPEFMGYVTEQGRHISMLTAYHSKAHKPETNEEKELCRTALHTLQIETGWQRRSKANHRDNYLIEGGKALLIDLTSTDSPEKVANNGPEWAQKLLDEEFDRCWNFPL